MPRRMILINNKAKRRAFEAEFAPLRGQVRPSSVGCAKGAAAPVRTRSVCFGRMDRVGTARAKNRE
jgi:hypothetical protein